VHAITGQGPRPLPPPGWYQRSRFGPLEWWDGARWWPRAEWPTGARRPPGAPGPRG
jgi:hypothetical protein